MYNMHNTETCCFTIQTLLDLPVLTEPVRDGEGKRARQIARQAYRPLAPRECKQGRPEAIRLAHPLLAHSPLDGKTGGRLEKVITPGLVLAVN